jgi:hypothetical protein
MAANDYILDDLSYPAGAAGGAAPDLYAALFPESNPAPVEHFDASSLNAPLPSADPQYADTPAAPGPLDSMANEVSGWFEGFATGAVAGATQAASDILGGARQAGSDVIGFGQGMVAGAEQAATDVGSAASSTVGGSFQALESGFTNVTSAASGALSNTLKGLGLGALGMGTIVVFGAIALGIWLLHNPKAVGKGVKYAAKAATA